MIDPNQEMMMRREHTLILPYNTIKLMDAMLQMEIYNAENKPIPGGFEYMLWKLCTRRLRNLRNYNKNIDQDIIDQLPKIHFADYYRLSPKTLMYDMLEIALHQKFMERITILSPDKKLVDPVFEVDYYDGTVKSLEDYIDTKDVTCIVCDNMEILKTISDNGRISFEYMSILVSKVGYNYDKVDEKFKLRYFEELKSKYPHMELAEVGLFNFSKENILKAYNSQKEGK